jgi:phage tail sheath protein FI
MPEYLAPGVYVEEVSFRSKSIEGVSTTTTGFVGPTRYGPVVGDLDVVTSLPDFERIYGDRQKLAFTADGADLAEPCHNYLWHGVRAFFENGGRRLYVKRIFRARTDADDGRASTVIPAQVQLKDGGAAPRSFSISPQPTDDPRALTVTLAPQAGDSALRKEDETVTVTGLAARDVIAVSWPEDQRPDVLPPDHEPARPPTPDGDKRQAAYYLVDAGEDGTLTFHRTLTQQAGTPQEKRIEEKVDPAALDPGDPKHEVRKITLDVRVTETAGGAQVASHDDLALDPQHGDDSLFATLSPNDAGGPPVVVRNVRGITDGLDVLDVLAATRPGIAGTLGAGDGSDVPTVAADLPGRLLRVAARFPGVAGSRRVRFTLRRGQNVLAGTEDVRVAGLLDFDVVEVTHGESATVDHRLAQRTVDVAGLPTWEFADSTGKVVRLADLQGGRDAVRLVTVTVTDLPDDRDSLPVVWSDLPLDHRHERAGTPDSLMARFAQNPANRADAVQIPLVIDRADAVGIRNGIDVLETLLALKAGFAEALGDDDTTDDDRSAEVRLDGGNDGQRPTAGEYENGGSYVGDDDKGGLRALADIEDISIVAAPGSTFGYRTAAVQANTIIQSLVAHCSAMRYRIAVLDSGDNQSLPEVRAMRAGIDTTYAAFYYPWVTVLDPVTQREIQLPPSGFVAGIYARNDIQRAVYKAPANEVVTLALRFEKLLNKAQQDVLNPEGINCFRYFPGRGYRLWGARTATSDPEWKYVNLRRYFAYLEHSIDRGTQWAVFEPNGDRLWANVRRTVEDFLFTEWQNGALLGEKPEKAFFVRCDRTTMTQNDLDNGRLVCQVGVAPLRPAEFVIFRVGQWTADRRG